MLVLRSVALFVLAALAETAGQPGRACASSASRCGCSGAYAFVATLQPDAHVGRILAAYGGVFEAPAWAMALDGFRPDRFDVLGAAVCLAGVG